MTTQTITRRTTPTSKLVLPSDAPREEWLRARKTRIGASDVPKILGIYGSALQVWYDKLGILPDQEPNDAMIFGTLFEEPIAQEWARRNRSVIRRVGLVEHIDEPFMACTLDRRVMECPLNRAKREQCGLEVKCRNAFGASDWGKSGIPDDVLAQVLHQIHVTGFDHMHVAVLIGGSDYRQRTVYASREAETLAYVVGETRKFWHEHIETHRRPYPNGDGDDLIDLDNRIHPNRAGVKDLSLEEYADAQELRERYGAEHRTAVEADKRKKLIQAELITMLGGAEIAIANDEPLYSYEERASRPKVDLQRLAERHPDAYAECVTATTCRTFNARLPRGKK